MRRKHERRERRVSRDCGCRRSFGLCGCRRSFGFCNNRRNEVNERRRQHRRIHSCC